MKRGENMFPDTQKSNQYTNSTSKLNSSSQKTAFSNNQQRRGRFEPDIEEDENSRSSRSRSNGKSTEQLWSKQSRQQQKSPSVSPGRNDLISPRNQERFSRNLSRETINNPEPERQRSRQSQFEDGLAFFNYCFFLTKSI